MLGLGILDAFAREAMLFAAVGLLIGGIDDLLVDLVFLARRSLMPNTGRRALDDLPLPAEPARLAVFVPAWDEARVIGAMLKSAVSRLDHPDWRLYVGLYPNDPATVDAAAAAAECDPRIRLVIGDQMGPTTKAGCLNTIWRAMQRDDAAEGLATRAIILHDAEDVVHRAELRVFDALLARHDVIQLPVLPLIKRDSRFVSAHYADEFAETHCTLPQRCGVRDWEHDDRAPSSVRQKGNAPCCGGTSGWRLPRITSETRPWLQPTRAAA